ncbi:acetyl/propionyl-CoA carboxylase subuit alpha [Sphingomonas melonis TY]|jgi:propionyl-CoA carboxylase alpha chain|uniref:propionyl-CoA carboxylase n=3 Tax=Sphingomonas melonis TaxID=152682 RepID=A0A175Y4D1_9SPHN|nr:MULTISPECIES: acetyl/propionyl/methylcrotonyl-CoA carboxylase subunit alpha [Sphingomonas]AOW22774.1 acetyl/propionyl-CoA carboxylase subuit alpha [Sphingomonas melonis TY]ATI56178.1 acetyl/propionyl/methylcrotonyl-CoA carboxylase subunit alpha [Sphingomonas melonis]KZB95295.1 acetyl/propionyl-CoA carboxylase subuit alpha [Sphingomonas melonis TY]MBI0530813.1 acetyl/propionyl/methylcrotonyl-CoA carboxylase subunit alpha [Sphingomonas sp. TX0522]MBX8845103.1 acetyl/propionyl/methylcrotonyl-C
MFKKILVANRGEIACRVFRTAKRMGIKTVAVYSDADARSPHVLMADEAVRLGPAPAAESYLKAELILLAAKETGADCIHPGYGFLSERESFAKACAEAGIAFVGPPPNAIAAMGDKIESKKLAKEAGVNVVPGFLGEIADTDEAVRIATDIGYPVMMKASAGGGGKGMRLAYSEQDVREGFEATKREGLASFGDDRVFIEKFIESPRHIEIQVLGDQHGNILYLNERECSVQRRHQKVVEEAPSPFVTPAMRKAMGEQAVALARAVGYYSAGTVELIVSGADTTGESFYFLEMNTRLQVEHPVTEEITGLDLVEQMIRVAAGERLSITQDQVGINGWSVENRVYAEDPYRGFLPSIGRLVRYNPPESTPSSTQADEPRIRVDDGVAEGGEVSMFYDPMIAKLVTWAPTREAAIDAQIAALDAFEIEGPGTNIDFLSALMQHPRFRSGNITTGFIAEEYPDGFHGAPADADLKRHLAAIAAFAATAQADRARRIDGQLGSRLQPPHAWAVRIDGEDHAVAVSTDGITVDGEALDIALEYTPGDRMVEAEIGEDARLTVRILPIRSGFRLTTRGASHDVRVLPAHAAPYAQHMIEKVPPDLSRFLIAPMPGLLVRLDVGAGDAVEAGQPLAVVEAMKMENILRAQKAGRVKAVSAAAGDSLAVDQIILEME